MKVLKNILKSVAAIGLFSTASCQSPHIYKSTVVDGDSYHSSYDDTTLSVDQKSILLPYNRFIDPAGKIIRYGNPALENHSLDCVLLPGNKVLAVEDRYGLALIDVQKTKLLFHLDYEGVFRGLVSTFSGIKMLEDEKGIHIFWGASNPGTKDSYILEALWDGQKALINNAISFNSVSLSPIALPNDIAINKEGG